MIYYGLSYNVTELSGDPYINFTISVVFELFAVVLSNFVYEKFGRKFPYLISLALSGLSLFCVFFVPKGISFFSFSRIEPKKNTIKIRII